MGAQCDRRRMRRLVAALRSGQYEQARGYLRVTEAGKTGYCCAGVACDLAARARVGRWEPGSGGHDYFISSSDSDDRGRMWLPHSVVAWLGLGSRGDPQSLPVGGDNTGIAMNDSGRTFGEIADALEAHYLA